MTSIATPSRLLLLAAVCVLALATACKADEKPAAAAAPKGISPIVTATFGASSTDDGERLFGQECGFCHVGKSTGTMMLERRVGKGQGELVDRIDLDADYVKTVVRNGLMNMPPLSRIEVTDEELDKIAAWLTRKGR